MERSGEPDPLEEISKAIVGLIIVALVYIITCHSLPSEIKVHQGADEVAKSVDWSGTPRMLWLAFPTSPREKQKGKQGPKKSDGRKQDVDY